jgi:hypothetical protein
VLIQSWPAGRYAAWLAQAVTSALCP